MKLPYWIYSNPQWDRFTNDPSYQAAIKAQLDGIVTFSPFWDSKLSWFPRALAYTDSYAIYTNLNNNSATVNANLENWVLKDVNGNKLYINWGGIPFTQYAADIGNSEFQMYMIGLMIQKMCAGYMGTFLDDVNGVPSTADAQGNPAVPIDPRYNTPMTNDAWNAYFSVYLKRLLSVLKSFGLKLMQNSVWFENAPIVGDYQMFEHGVSDGGLTGGTGQWSIHSFFQSVAKVKSQGTIPMMNESGDVQYAYACALLSQSAIGFPDITPDQWNDNFKRLTNVDMGKLLSPPTYSGGLYIGTFDKGLVFVLEPGAETFSMTLATLMTNAYNNTPTDSIHLTGKQGIILLN